MKYIKILSIALLLAIASNGCKQAKLIVDIDKGTDFTKYTTYKVLPWRPENSEFINKVNQNHLYTALRSEMNARGLTEVKTDADLSANIFVFIGEETAYSRYTGYYSGGGWGYAYPMGYGYTRTRYESYEVLQGTVLVDVFDDKSKKLIFQSAAIAEVKEENPHREKSINKIMSKIFWDYPIKKKK